MNISNHKRPTHNPTEWFCHCCTARNVAEAKQCRVCGRDESYVQRGNSYLL